MAEYGPADALDVAGQAQILDERVPLIGERTAPLLPLLLGNNRIDIFPDQGRRGASR